MEYVLKFIVEKDTFIFITQEIMWIRLKYVFWFLLLHRGLGLLLINHLVYVTCNMLEHTIG